MSGSEAHGQKPRSVYELRIFAAAGRAVARTSRYAAVPDRDSLQMLIPGCWAMLLTPKTTSLKSDAVAVEIFGLWESSFLFGIVSERTFRWRRCVMRTLMRRTVDPNSFSVMHKQCRSEMLRPTWCSVSKRRAIILGSRVSFVRYRRISTPGGQFAYADLMPVEVIDSILDALTWLGFEDHRMA